LQLILPYNDGNKSIIAKGPGHVLYLF